MMGKAVAAPAKRRKVEWWQEWIVLCNWWRRNIVALASLPSLCWPLCHCWNGAISVIVQVPLLLLCWRCCPHCTGVVAIVALALLSLLRWCALALSPTLLRRNCCRNWNGAVAIAQVSLPLLHLHHLPCHAGIFVVVALVLLPSMHLRCCIVVLASSPLLHWHLCHHCAGIVAIVAMAPLPSMR